MVARDPTFLHLHSPPTAAPPRSSSIPCCHWIAKMQPRHHRPLPPSMFELSCSRPSSSPCDALRATVTATWSPPRQPPAAGSRAFAVGRTDAKTCCRDRDRPELLPLAGPTSTLEAALTTSTPSDMPRSTTLGDATSTSTDDPGHLRKRVPLPSPCTTTPKFHYKMYHYRRRRPSSVQLPPPLIRQDNVYHYFHDVP